MKFFDIHSHLNFPDYTDLDQAISRMKKAGVGTIVVGTDLESSRLAVEISDQDENIWACIGVHPVNKVEQSFDKQSFEELVGHPKVVAVGECGLDFFHADKTLDYKRQKKLFLDQINFALDHDLPVMIHARDAYEEILEILEPLKIEKGSLHGDVHFFAGNAGIAKRFINIGFTLSFTGVITFTRDYDEVIKSVPLDMIMSETDAPYVAPVPYRGKRNEPSYVTEVVKKIAEIRGEDLEMVQNTLISNASRVFRINYSSGQ